MFRAFSLANFRDEYRCVEFTRGDRATDDSVCFFYDCVGEIRRVLKIRYKSHFEYLERTTSVSKEVAKVLCPVLMLGSVETACCFDSVIRDAGFVDKVTVLFRESYELESSTWQSSVWELSRFCLELLVQCFTFAVERGMGDAWREFEFEQKMILQSYQFGGIF